MISLGNQITTVKIFILILAVLLSAHTFAQNNFWVKKVNDQVYILTEIWKAPSNANVGVVIGVDGVLLINSLMMNSAEALEKEVKKITDKPIKYIINSDADPYNHHANKYFHDKGATIYAHKNLKYSTAFTDILFDQQISIPMGNEIVTAYHTPAHQLNHIDIYLEKSNVLFMSDAFNGHWFTYTGANGLEGYITGIEKALSVADEHTIVVTGNTSKDQEDYLYNRNDLARMKQVHIAFANRIDELHKTGIDVETIAKDQEIDELAKKLKAYTTHSPYIKYLIMEAIEANSEKPYPLTKEQLSAYVGVYQLNNESSIEIFLVSGKLYARDEGTFFFELTPLSATTFDFKAETANIYLEFHLLSTREVKSVTPVLEKDGWWSAIIKEGTYKKLINTAK